MKTTSVFRLVLLAMMALTFGFFTSAFGDDTAQKNMERARTLLRDAAWDSDTNAPTSNDKRIELLKQANELLQDIPIGGYHGHLLKAQGYVKDALAEATKGASDENVTGYIHDAETEIRSME